MDYVKIYRKCESCATHGVSSRCEECYSTEYIEELIPLSEFAEKMFRSTQGKPYVVKLSGRTDGKTTSVEIMLETDPCCEKCGRPISEHQGGSDGKGLQICPDVPGNVSRKEREKEWGDFEAWFDSVVEEKWMCKVIGKPKQVIKRIWKWLSEPSHSL